MKKCFIVMNTFNKEPEAISAQLESAKRSITEQEMTPVTRIGGNREKSKAELQTANERRREALSRAADVLYTMAECEAVYFCKDYQKSRAGVIFHCAAKRFKLEAFYEVPPVKRAKKPFKKKINANGKAKGDDKKRA